VLIIDDNAGLVNLLQRYLSDRACRVTAAANGLEGLALARKIRPDAIVLDIMMPEMDGWEVLQRLRNDPQTTHIPVIICTVVAEPDLAQALKASHFLPKPVRQVEVLDALRQLGVV
jgi:CheY-like chemotaxis protein